MEKKIIEYTILRGTDVDLFYRNAGELLIQNWQPFGSICVTTVHLAANGNFVTSTDHSSMERVLYAQAFVRYQQ